MPRKKSKSWIGIRRKRGGYQARVDVVGCPEVTQQFPLSATTEEMQAWRTKTRNQLRQQIGMAPARGSFEADVAQYLRAVTAMPTYKERVQHLEEWIAVFRGRRRATIQPHEIRAQRDRWLTTPRIVTRRRRDRATREWITVTETKLPYSASAVNHRLRALSNLWTVLDGRRAENPVREVPEATEPDDPPRALPYTLIEACLDAMPDRGRAARGDKRPTVSHAKAIARVLAYVGISPAELKRAQPHHVQWTEAAMWAPGRRKGAGSAGRMIPLTAKGVEALRALEASGAWQSVSDPGRLPLPFSVSGVRKAWQRAVAKVSAELAEAGVIVPPRIRLYDLRHSFATVHYARGGDLHATGQTLGHGDPRTTLRYARAAVDPRLRDIAEKLDAWFKQGAKPAQATGPSSQPTGTKVS